MHEAFATIEVGTIATEYHRAAIDEAFRDSLSKFLEETLLPQLDEPYQSTEGTITPCFNEEKYCGPNSAVRDAYRLKFSFVRESGADDFEGEIYRNPEDGSFRMRYPRQPMVLWTATRKRNQEENQKKFDTLVRRIGSKKVSGGRCPSCNVDLKVTQADFLFDIRCPSGCFEYHVHGKPNGLGIFIMQLKRLFGSRRTDSTNNPPLD